MIYDDKESNVIAQPSTQAHAPLLHFQRSLRIGKRREGEKRERKEGREGEKRGTLECASLDL
jgi:hypothetical protein